MADKDTLLDRLYSKKETKKNVHFLRPKNPGHIAPTLTTPRSNSRQGDGPAVPQLTIPSDVPMRPHTALGEITVGSGRPPISVRRFLPNSGRPTTAQPEKKKRPQTAFAAPPPSSKKNAIPRSRPPTLVPIEVRPSTAIADSRFDKHTGRPLGLTRPSTAISTFASSRINENGEITDSIFRLKKSNFAAQHPEEYEQFKKDPLYTPDISDELWNDPNLIFYYIRLIRQKNLNEEFLYFQSQPPTYREPENVYFLVVVPPTEVNWDDYYTLSADGITSYNKSKGEFTKLDQWIRECVIYIKIKNISFFKLYEQWRSFTLLHTITKCQLITAANTSITNTYFNVDAVLRKAVLDLQSCCNRLLKYSLVDVKSSQTLTLQQFIDRQYAHEAEVSVHIRELLEEARISIVHACDVTYESTGSNHDAAKAAKKEAEQQEKKQAKKKPIHKHKTQEKKKKSIASSDMMVYTQLATQRFCYKRLSRFIRLCDYMLIHTLYVFVVESCRQLVDFLQPRGNASGGDITRLSTEVVIEEGKLAFSPSKDEMIDEIKAIWLHLVSNIYLIQTFSIHQSLAQYAVAYGWVEPVVPLTRIIQNDNLYKKLSEEMIERITLAYKMSAESIEVFEPELQAYLRNIKFDVHKVQAENHNAEFYSEALKNYRAEIAKMDSLANSSQVHMMLIKLKGFVDMIKPTPRKCLEQLNALIPCIAENKVNKLTQKVSDALAILHNDPQDIHVFVEQLEFRKKQWKDFDTIRNDYKDATEFYTLIEKNRITTTEDAIGSYRSLGSLITQLESAMISMNEEEENKIKKWTSPLATLLQKVRKELLDVHYKTSEDKVMRSDSNPDEVIRYLMNCQDDVNELQERAEQIQKYQRVLQLKVSPIDELTTTSTNLNLKLLLWQTWKEWKEKAAAWAPTPFKTIDVDDFTNDLQKFTRVSMQVNSGLNDHPLVPIFKNAVNSFNEVLPVIVALTNPCLLSSHWTKIEHITGIPKLEETNFPLSFLMDKRIADFVDLIESIANDASNEAGLRKMLQEIQSTWDKIEFTMIPHKEIKDFYLVGDLEDVIAQLDETQVQLSTIRSSRYVGAIKSEVDEISKSMNQLAKCLDYITTFQIAFNSLNKVFMSPDIQHALSADTKKLFGIERDYKNWGRNARDILKVFKLCSTTKAVALFEGWIAQTEEIQKSLENFLQRKRTAFPRFYFLSNENLLKIFAEARNPKAVQPFLPKLFDGIHTLEFSSTGQDILAMCSIEGEKISLLRCQTLGAIENWLTNVEKGMKMSLHKIFKVGRDEYESLPRVEWIQKHPAQVISVVSQIFFSHAVNDALSTPNPIESLTKLRDSMEENLSSLADVVRCQLPRAMRSGIVALITLDVHSRDIVSELIGSEVTNKSDFEWTKRLRYEWDVESNRVVINQAGATMEYGYEYLGATSRLVVTPLTERCYLTLTSAMANYLGGSPAGPAGTGKTETVKDLAKAVGNFCVVFNCSDAVTVIQMESFFSGLAQAGAWACFDEFNRINSEVLSVIAEQVYQVQSAVAAKLTHFVFCDQNIPLNSRVGVFITMNPGYAGRTELPDNLKSLFRPIAMMVPGYAMIAEVILYSEGFSSAKPLAQKVTQLYKLSSEMLSQQSHYDFGMRALKSVLVMAGASKRRMPSLNEDIILIRAMRDSNISKLLIDDSKLFDAIIGDLFPGVEFEKETFEELSAAIDEALLAKHLQKSDFMTIKTIQLYQTIFIRHGVMLVGPTGGGKTTSRNILSDSLAILGTPVEQYEINPKAVTLTDLYGAYNLVTGDWKNGLVGKMFSEMAEADQSTQQWIIFDGPVDALWIENMNTVLDDNKLLSLANSDRIKMTDQMHLLFEVGDLAQASPATVSRCGMVYYQPEDLGWRPLVNSWIEKQPEVGREIYSGLFELTFDPAVETLRENCKTVVVPLIWNIATSLCYIIDAVIADQNINIAEAPQDQLEKYITHIFAYAMTWAFGGIITDESRGDFDTFMREMFERKINYPTRRTLFDYSLDVKNTTFTLWSDIIANEKPTKIVPTSDTARFSNILLSLIKRKRPVLFLGESGCGKTSIIQNTLSSQMSSIFSILFTLSARTSAEQIQDLIEAKLLQKRKTLFGPPEGKSAVLVVDDFNLPRPDTYWSQPPIEILRTIINCKGLYNREELYWYHIEDVTIVAAGMQQGFVTPRFTSRFTILSLPAPSDSVLTCIFETILHQFLNGFSDSVVEMEGNIVKASVVFYRKIKAELLPTPSRSHYTFNLRDLSRVFQGILLTNMNSLSDPQTFIKLWLHENMRVFGDRLIDDKDRNQMVQTVYEIAKNVLKVKEEISSIFGEMPLIWTDILKGYGDSSNRSYQEATSMMQINAALTTFTDMYKSQVVLFKEAIEHILRIVRVMRQPSGHMLLVGMGGTGKRTAAKFAAFVAEMEVFQPQPAKEYRIADFRNDLRGLFKLAGAQNRPVMFLLTDEQIVDEAFLEDINNVLNTGEVPGLFETEEYDQMVNELVPMMKKAGESLAYDSLCRRFTSNIMKNLHVVLALSPVGGRFRDRCRIFPALVNCCTIDWFEPWPATALETVAQEFIAKMDLDRFGDVRTKLANIATFAHTTIVEASRKFQNELNRIYYVTPAVYIEFFSLFNTMLTKRVNEHEQKKQQLTKGVEKLAETNQKVQEMEAELHSLRPQLQKKAVETDALMAKLKVDREKVNEAHKLISAEEETVKKVRSEAMVLAAEAQDDLDRAMPLLNAAKAAVEDLKNRKADLAVVKTFVKPPQLVVEVMEAVCLLNGHKPDWASAKSLLAQTDFFNRLLEVHNNPIPEATLARIRQMDADPRYDIKKVMSVSESAACLFKWVTAIEKYVTESQRIAPKQKRRDEAQATLQEAEEKLKSKQDELQVISTQLATLQLQYEESINQQKELQQKIEQCEYRLKNASQLTTALDSERVRWTANLAELDEAEKSLLGDTLMIALHVAYIGPFSFPYRTMVIQQLIKKCDLEGITITKDFILENIATEPVTLREWQVNGLPQDALSKQNGVLVTMTRRWPLLIDPQGQGRKWLLENSGMRTVRCDDSNMAITIENAIKVGSPILVEDVGEILDPGLQFILSPKLQKQSGQLMISIGDKWIPFDPQFKLYLTTKLSNPQFLPDVFIHLSVINFSVTLEGLEEQLLSDVVLHEMPELEKQRVELIVAISKDQKTLSDLMTKILHLLFTSRGNILDNETLITTLHDAKQTSTQVAERLVESEKTEKEITEKREVYRNVATRGSILYFVVLELPGIDSMYQYSLEFFKRIFKSVLDNADHVTEIDQKCLMFIDKLTYAVFSNVSRGLFANHREVLSFLIAMSLLRSTDQVTDDMWKLFLRGPVDVDLSKFEDPIDAIEPRIWSKCCALSKAMPVFTELPGIINKNYSEWQKLIEESSIEFPKPFDSVSLFHKLIIASCIARRKVVSLVRMLVKEVLGEQFIQQADVDLSAPFADTSNDTPLLFILSQGADPRESLEKLAEKKGFAEKLKILSLGQGRGPTASEFVKKAKKDGHWVFLQNCHLCPSFLPTLEMMTQKMVRKANKFHSNFRLILSSMPTDVFPISVLRNSVKVTSEPPSGIQPNVSLLMNTLSNERWESCSKTRPWKKLLFGIAVFHATISERKRYGALGFNKIYEWNTSDFSIAVKMLHTYISQHDQVPWVALRQMIGDVVYGGRVTDDWDRRCMNAVLDRFLCKNAMNDDIFFDSDNLYPSIPLCKFDQVFSTIQAFPTEDSPSIFGFHPSALNALHLNQSNKLIEWVLGVQPRDTGGSAASKDDEIVMNIVHDLSGQIPLPIVTKHAHQSLFESNFGDRPNSLTVVLMQEIERFNQLINIIHQSLSDVEKAIKGEVVMSIDIAEVYRSLLDRQVPKQWKEAAYPSVRPLASWCADLVEKVNFITNWLRKGEPNVFWFPGFFFPQSFLTAVLQNHSRKHQVPIDKLSFEAKVLPNTVDSLAHPAPDGAYIHGMYFDGAKWDKDEFCLTDCDSNAVYTDCPVIHIIPKIDFVHPKDEYKCPVYRTPERAGVLNTTGHSTNFVVALNIPSKEFPDKWTLRGTALLLETPY
ncbi:Dynein heavy chain family protein [Tritrichomonas foetus]|uniref:Dynein heavy chain family protein n=1 Tax=Tritrichomonas foetus TaxID=1144522 RepID=A0A1J4KMQ5_9EUKA|nr:Dynein heavy chain family protein [Tritrichomonas foetus]|eukprot:OHT12593.1 Dynein heavy chain family protein [Tritrichomonas foetus]